MRHEFNRSIVLTVLLGTLLIIPVAVNAESGGQSKGHREVTAVVTAEKSGLLTVKLPDGSTMSLNPKNAERHGLRRPRSAMK